MKLAVYGDHRVAIVDGNHLYDVSHVVPGASNGWPPVFMTRLIANFAELGPALLDAKNKAEPIARSSVRLLAPIPLPGHVVAAPANYAKHVGELGERAVTERGKSARDSGFFLKTPSSVVGCDGAIVIPRGSKRRFDHEAELAVVVGKVARNISRDRALEFVFGYSCLMDITMRLEPGRVPEERPMRKSFDTFTPLGPYLVTADEIKDPQALDIQLSVNGDIKQQANTKDMIVGVAELIELISSVMTLNPGDVIATGTPEGVGPIEIGDRVQISVSQIGSMSLPVMEATENSPHQF